MGSGQAKAMGVTPRMGTRIIEVGGAYAVDDNVSTKSSENDDDIPVVSNKRDNQPPPLAKRFSEPSLLPPSPKTRRSLSRISLSKENLFSGATSFFKRKSTRSKTTTGAFGRNLIRKDVYLSDDVINSVQGMIILLFLS